MKQKTLLILSILFTATLAVASDPHSFSNPDQVQVTHIDFELNADLEKETLDGTAIYTLDRKNIEAPLILDSKFLTIQFVDIFGSKSKKQPLEYKLGEKDEIKGQSITIQLPKDPKVTKVRIIYSASKDSDGLQWNSSIQTSSKRPLLLSNSEPIGTRSWLPCQDTPTVRTTFKAKIDVEQKDLIAVMAADGNPTKTNTKGEYQFNMNIPIPSYLIAFAIGRLEFQSTGKRTGVYAEPSMIEKATNEFMEAEKMLEAAEKLYGKYVWGRYDLLVLPASYPWGGMENPKLTFITPTIITGKKDLVDVVAHEIAHSWSGNLVTNAQWSDLWINEGFTTYVQYRIIEELRGTPIRMRDMALDKSFLEEEFKNKELAANDTRLNADYTNRDPGDAFSDIPYVKGALFLYTIETKVGKPTFDKFLKDYFQKYTFKSITTDQVMEELSKIVDKAFLDEWINKPYLPKSVAAIPSTIIDGVNKDVKTFKMVGGAPNKNSIANMTSKDIAYYLQSLPRKASIYKLDHLEAAFGFSKTPDPSVRTEWYKLTLPQKYKPSMETAGQFLSEVGRGRYILPIYRALMKTKPGSAIAQNAFEKNKLFYAPHVRNEIKGIVEHK
jgi:leukotriene-A4 hydrolase